MTTMTSSYLTSTNKNKVSTVRRASIQRYMSRPIQLTILFLLCCVISALLPGAVATYDEFTNPPVPEYRAYRTYIPHPPVFHSEPEAPIPQVKPQEPSAPAPAPKKKNPDEESCLATQPCILRAMHKI
jgi:hypothetical protein